MLTTVRRYAILLMALALVLPIFAACGGQAPAPAQPPAQQEEPVAEEEAEAPEEVEEAEEAEEAEEEAEEAEEAEEEVEEAEEAEEEVEAEEAWMPRDLDAMLDGAGASFPDPLYQKWIEDYQTVAPGVAINYQPVGSGQGIKNFLGDVTDFGGTDKYVSEEDIASYGKEFFHIPTVLGAVVTTYNLPGVEELQFSPETLANIFMGNITNWSDPAIAADNPDATLPDIDITVVHRSDSSGTSSIFTNYLSSVSTEWSNAVGAGSTVEWPTGIGAEKNPGVAQAVKQTEGSIGYVELIYAMSQGLPTPAIQNAVGNYVMPSLESTSEAADGFLADMPDDLRVDIVNPPEGENAYPIAGFTWILVRAEMEDETKAQALTDFLYWTLTEGSDMAIELGYAPLPDSVRVKAVEKLEQVTVGGTSVFEAPAGATAMPAEEPAAEEPAAEEPAAEEPAAAADSDWLPRDIEAELNGSGASFPDPIYQTWIENYQMVAPGVSINYQAVGSGQGIKDFLGDVTDFGGTDKYVPDEDLADYGQEVYHIPTVLGAVVTTYNLPGIDELQFSPETLANIFMGNITTWNDPAIAADNPDATLPETEITVVHRSDSSGTSSIFTNYLTSVSEEWADSVGAGSTVEWPTGIGAEKNPGVAQAVKQTEGAIGYVELIYAMSQGLPTPAIQNATGNYVMPSLESTSAAADGFLSDMPDDLRVDIVNPPEGENAYPIAGFTWVLVRAEMEDETKAQALTDYLYWALTEGDEAAMELGYAPLPDSVREKAIEKLAMVTVGGTSVFEAPAGAAMAEEPVEEPVEEPTEEPAEEPTEEPAEEPTEEPTEEPAEDTTADADGEAWLPRDIEAELNGSGASFPDPIYQTWIEDYQLVAPGVSINYQAVGSGQGIKDFLGDVTDFGGTDKYVPDEDLADYGQEVYHIPTVLGAVVTTYNLPGVDELKFSPDTLANIFMGNITTWDDTAIAEDNPDATLPDTEITVVHRSDSSGTSSIFTNYLTSVSEEWADSVGAGSTVEWPTGIGAEKNPGVAQAVKQTEGAIGYVELIYAMSQKLPTPAIMNATGNYVMPSLESTSAAADGFLADMPDDLRVDIVNPQEGENAYPIAGFTWILVRAEMEDMTKAEALTDYLYWALTEGDEAAMELGYAPLPDSVREKAIEKLAMVTVGGTPVFEAPAGAAMAEEEAAEEPTEEPTEEPAEEPTEEPTEEPAEDTTADADGEAWLPRDIEAELNGSGASFPDPIYQTWIEDYQLVAPGVSINYQAVGSGQGIKDFLGDVTDFGGTDKYVPDEDLADYGQEVYHIPTVLGAVVTTYNLPGIDELKFSPDTLANIFMGNITTWDDAAIAEDNPDATLPDTEITVVHRSDSSGTSSIFTNYLTSVSEEWADSVGAGSTVEWPTGIGAEKNPGVAQAVKQTEGAIGYVELIYAMSQKLPTPAIMNATGNYVMPSLESTSAAADGFLADMPDDLRVDIVNPQEGENAYPIAGFTWILVRAEMEDMTKAEALTDYLYWALTEGDEAAMELGYAPLPDSVREKAIEKLTMVTVGGENVFEMP